MARATPGRLPGRPPRPSSREHGARAQEVADAVLGDDDATRGVVEVGGCLAVDAGSVAGQEEDEPDEPRRRRGRSAGTASDRGTDCDARAASLTPRSAGRPDSRLARSPWTSDKASVSAGSIVDVGRLGRRVHVDAEHAVGRGQLALDLGGPCPAAAKAVDRDPESARDIHVGSVGPKAEPRVSGA